MERVEANVAYEFALSDADGFSRPVRILGRDDLVVVYRNGARLDLSTIPLDGVNETLCIWA